MTAPLPEWRLVVDGAACDGHGICALVMPEQISLDEWGYANVDATPPGDARALARARRAVRACPAHALSLVGDPSVVSGARGPLRRRAAGAWRRRGPGE